MTYDEQIAAIEADQLGKLFRKDDHGVMDCAADLREIKAEKRGYEKGYVAAMSEETQQSKPFSETVDER